MPTYGNLMVEVRAARTAVGQIQYSSIRHQISKRILPGQDKGKIF